MPQDLNPKPSEQNRKTIASNVRQEAAAVAAERTNPIVQAHNGDLLAYSPPVATFTKSLAHNAFGLVSQADADTTVDALNQSGSSTTYAPFPGVYPFLRPAEFGAPIYSGSFYQATAKEAILKPRTWESPLAGHTYDLEGPDADAVAMPPAPALGSDELIAEVGELYAMALLRDVPFNEFEGGQGGTAGPRGLSAEQARQGLNQLAWFDGAQNPNGSKSGGGLTKREQVRRQARLVDGGKLSMQTLFRGSPEGARKGPYLSQFLLIGNAERGGPPVPLAGAAAPAAASADAAQAQRPFNVPGTFIPDDAGDLFRQAEAVTATLTDAGHGRGAIQYGQQVISQKLIGHTEEKDFMQGWAEWLDVQNGLDARQRATFRMGAGNARFLHTPRDLCTYVHYDALYQAYLNAALILISQEASFDAGLPEGPGHPSRTGFATFGVPHLLSLLTEVATRALKAVRRQKFLVHLRARPEAVAGAMTLASAAGRPSAPDFYAKAETMINALSDTGPLYASLQAYNAGKLPDVAKPEFDWLADASNWLLPMAFPEGSPVHGSYGAGHATVAGACATVIKAFFEMYKIEAEPGDLFRKPGKPTLKQLIDSGVAALFPAPYAMTEIGPDPAKRIAGTYRTNADGSALSLSAAETDPAKILTVEGELDKLATNIAIARNFAGVHYYTDYYESLRLGERVAAGILQERMLTYREPVSMRFTSFDGDRIMIVASGGARHGTFNGEYDEDDAQILVWPKGEDAPAWTTATSTKTRDLRIREEANRWWNRAQMQQAM